ncbi:MAG: hypothetical protein HYR63_27305 [Proteobacteria bacterium]|nr:hypothetical protein [Pseudomonadota bacterium]MBI3498340.1 hypothetical protein [Pseudomonadota bacterium]
MSLASASPPAGNFAAIVRADAELEAEIVEIDRMLESQSAWLTPRCRTALLSAREVLVHALERRKDYWPPVRRPERDAGDHAFSVRERERSSA